jgi:hypothetical protein
LASTATKSVFAALVSGRSCTRVSMKRCTPIFARSNFISPPDLPSLLLSSQAIVTAFPATTFWSRAQAMNHKTWLTRSRTCIEPHATPIAFCASIKQNCMMRFKVLNVEVSSFLPFPICKSMERRVISALSSSLSLQFCAAVNMFLYTIVPLKRS